MSAYVLLAWKLNANAIGGVEVYCSALSTYPHLIEVERGLRLNGYSTRLEKIHRTDGTEVEV